MTLPPGTRVGAYEITGPLGAGGMGEVYRARDTKLNRDVAVKVLPLSLTADAEYLARFQREAQLLAALNHPNIAAIYGLEGEAIIMELVEGETLAQRIAVGPIPLEDALPIAMQIAAALEAAHDKGIIHRDLKPANVKVTPQGVAKVLDFGLAKAADEGSAANLSISPTLTLRSTQAGVILGTAAYMAPEQARGKPVDKRADIWAFGCLLYEMLVGKQTFSGDSIIDILGAVVRAEPEWSKLPAGTPENVRRVLRRCLEKDPARRLRDIGDARLELTDPVAPPAAPAPVEVTRRAASVWMIGAVAAVSGAAGFFARGLRKTAEPAPKPVRRFRLPLGATRLTLTLRISPDGSRIAYISNDNQLPGGRPIVVRTLDGSEARRLPGTEGANALVFSPDGQWIAFRSSAVFKVPVGGGSPIRLFDGWIPSDWTATGQLLLTTGRPGQGIASISAQGGQVQELIKVDSNRVFSNVSMLPGTNVLLFSMSGASIAVQTVGANDRKVIIENGVTPSYLRSGHILFRGDDTWRVVPFDLKTLRTTGAAVPLPGPESRAMYLAADETGTAIFSTLGSFTQRTALQILDRQGRILETLKISEPFTQLRASPDGRFIILSHQANSDVFVYDLKRGIQTKLTFETGEDETPVWAPDSKRYAYASVRDRNERHIVVRQADGSSGEQILWTTPAHIHVDDWSADGKFLMLTRAGNSSDLLVLSTEKAGEPKPFLTSPFHELHGAFSPDGRWVAYTSNESGRDEIYVRPWPGPGGKWQVSSEGGIRPRWSRNGKELFYNSKTAMMAVPVESKAEFSTGKPKPLFEKSFGEYDVLPDGRFVLFDAPVVMGVAELDVIENWFEELKRIAPARQ
jgi:serine/threonine-protein kinase